MLNYFRQRQSYGYTQNSTSYRARAEFYRSRKISCEYVASEMRQEYYQGRLSVGEPTEKMCQGCKYEDYVCDNLPQEGRDIYGCLERLE